MLGIIIIPISGLYFSRWREQGEDALSRWSATEALQITNWLAYVPMDAVSPWEIYAVRMFCALCAFNTFGVLCALCTSRCLWRSLCALRVCTLGVPFLIYAFGVLCALCACPRLWCSLRTLRVCILCMTFRSSRFALFARCCRPWRFTLFVLGALHTFSKVLINICTRHPRRARSAALCRQAICLVVASGIHLRGDARFHVLVVGMAFHPVD